MPVSGAMAPPTSAVANTWASSAFGKSRLLSQDPNNSWVDRYGNADPWADGDPGPKGGKDKGKGGPESKGTWQDGPQDKGKGGPDGKGTWQDGPQPKGGKAHKGKASSMASSSTSMPAVPELDPYLDAWHKVTSRLPHVAPMEETEIEDEMQRAAMALSAVLSDDPAAVAEVRRRINRSYNQGFVEGNAGAQEAAMRARASEGREGGGPREAARPVLWRSRGSCVERRPVRGARGFGLPGRAVQLPAPRRPEGHQREE